MTFYGLDEHDEWFWAMFEPTWIWPNVDFRQLFMWIEVTYMNLQINITFGWLQKLNPGYEICIISYQVNLSSEVSAMFNSLMPSADLCLLWYFWVDFQADAKI